MCFADKDAERVARGRMPRYKNAINKSIQFSKLCGIMQLHNFWDKYYFKRYRVDYDYYPRGRVVYDTNSGKFLIYRDVCIPDEEMHKFSKDYASPNYVLLLDEHYRYHKCNRSYVNLFK